MQFLTHLLYLALWYYYVDTTDVQKVQVSEMGGKDDHMIRIQCDFMLGSSAKGCMVIMLGEFDNATVNLTRGSNGSSEAVTHHKLAYSLSCYNESYALDIEADGLLGSLSLPVIIMSEGTMLPAECSLNEEASVQSERIYSYVNGCHDDACTMTHFMQEDQHC